MSVLKFRDENGNFIPIRTIKGSDGRGIVSIEKINTLGNIDTYEIVYTDNTTTTYDITNAPSSHIEVNVRVNDDGEINLANWITENPYTFVENENNQGRYVFIKTNVYHGDTLIQNVFVPQTINNKEIYGNPSKIFTGVLDHYTQITAVLTSDNNLSIENIPFVKDSNYVHTDYNFTQNYKNKLDGLSNYDDSSIKQEIKDLETNKANINDIPDVSDYITKDVSDLSNYYSKNETYTKEEINNNFITDDELDEKGFVTVLTQDLLHYYTKEEISTLLQIVQNSRFKVVAELPTNPQSNVIYLVLKEETENNIYNEFIWVDNKWEQIGSTEVKLDGVATEEFVENKIADFLTKEEIQNLIQESLPTFNRDFNIKNEDGVVKTFTNTGAVVDDKYIFTQGLPNYNIYSEVLFTDNEYTIVYAKGTNYLFVSRNGIDFEQKMFSYNIKNVIRLVENNRLIALCNGGNFYYSDDDGVTWNSTQVSNYSTYDKVVNYLEYTDSFGIVQVSTRTFHFLNNNFSRTDYLTSAITPNFTTMLNQSQILWCDYNGNVRYKAGSREGNVANLPSGRVSFFKRVNGVVYGGYQNDNKIAYLNGTTTTSSWLTYTLPDTCTVNDIIYNAKDQTYYILTDINTYYKTKDFLTFESFEKDNIRIAQGTMTLVGLMGVSSESVNYVYVAPTQQKIEDTLQELKRAVNKERWVGTGLQLDGEVISVKGSSPIMVYANGVSLMWGSVDVGYLLPEQAEKVMTGGYYRHNVYPSTIADEIWNLWDGSDGVPVNVMFLEGGTFYDPMSWETEYTVEKGDYGYLISRNFGMEMPFIKTGSLAPFFN